VKVVYDTRHLGCGYDFVTFLCIANGMRQRYASADPNIDLVILTGPDLRKKRSDLSKVEEINSGSLTVEHFMTTRLHRILLPSTSLVPNIRSVNVLSEHAFEHFDFSDVFFPMNYVGPKYDYEQKYENYYSRSVQLWMFWATSRLGEIRVLRNSKSELDRASRLVSALTGSDNPIVFTLRNNSMSSDRTRDNTDSFLEIALDLAKKHPVLIVPDTEDVFSDRNTNLPVCTEAALDLRVRAAVYELARANFIGNNGPGLLLNMNANAVYYQAGFASSGFHSLEWYKANEAKALEVLRESGHPIKGGIFDGSNPYAPQDNRQVFDFEPLTVAKAKSFISRVAT